MQAVLTVCSFLRSRVGLFLREWTQWHHSVAELKHFMLSHVQSLHSVKYQLWDIKSEHINVQLLLQKRDNASTHTHTHTDVTKIGCQVTQVLHSTRSTDTVQKEETETEIDKSEDIQEKEKEKEKEKKEETKEERKEGSEAIQVIQANEGKEGQNTSTRTRTNENETKRTKKKKEVQRGTRRTRTLKKHKTRRRGLGSGVHRTRTCGALPYSEIKERCPTHGSGTPKKKHGKSAVCDVYGYDSDGNMHVCYFGQLSYDFHNE